MVLTEVKSYLAICDQALDEWLPVAGLKIVIVEGGSDFALKNAIAPSRRCGFDFSEQTLQSGVAREAGSFAVLGALYHPRIDWGSFAEQ